MLEVAALWARAMAREEGLQRVANAIAGAVKMREWMMQGGTER